MRRYYRVKPDLSTETGKRFWQAMMERAKQAKTPQISCYDIDKLDPFAANLKDDLSKINKQMASLDAKRKKLQEKKLSLINEIQNKCAHEECLEEQTHYDDEYGSSHEGPKRRICIRCFLVEREYDSYFVAHERRNDFLVLKNSKKVYLHKFINGEEYELEFSDLEKSYNET